jgi:hypothetical protein
MLHDSNPVHLLDAGEVIEVVVERETNQPWIGRVTLFLRMSIGGIFANPSSVSHQTLL